MTVGTVCTLVALFMVFVLVTGVKVMMDDYRTIGDWRRNLEFVLNNSQVLGNPTLEGKIINWANELLTGNAKRVASKLVTYAEGRKYHRSICTEYFEFGDTREKLMSEYDTLVSEALKN